MSNYAIVEAMQRFGGSFAQALGYAFAKADANNFARLKSAFPDLWAEYDDMARLLHEQGKGGA